MKTKVLLPSILLFGGLLFAQSTDTPKPSDGLLKRIEALEDAVDRHQTALKIVANGVINGFAPLPTKLDPASSEVSPLLGITFNLLVSLLDVVPYLEGQRLFLKLGNPTSATIIGGSLEWSYGADPKHPTTVITTFSDQLPPGAWTKISAVLPDAPASQLKNLTVRFTPKHVALRSAPDK